MTRRDPVIIAWGIGLVLAVLVFMVGPDHFLFRLANMLHVFAWQLGEFLAELSATALDAIRALSIGLFVTFLALGMAVARRGGRAKGAIVVVSLVYFLLVSSAAPGDQARWVAALVLSGVGAAVMTGRLRQGAMLIRP